METGRDQNHPREGICCGFFPILRGAAERVSGAVKHLVCVCLGMPPHMVPRPGMPHMAPAPATGALPSRPAAPAVQPAVTKPLFPSAAQVITMSPPPARQHTHTHTHPHVGLFPLCPCVAFVQLSLT